MTWLWREIWRFREGKVKIDMIHKSTLEVVKSANQTGNPLVTQGLLLIRAWQIGRELKACLRQEIGI